MKEKNFKKKLTLSLSGVKKKRPENIEYAKNQNKTSVIIEKKNFRPKFKRTGQQLTRNSAKFEGKPFKDLGKDLTHSVKDFEKSQLAEQRATRRVKGQVDDVKISKTKINDKKREYKLTLSRALDEDSFGFNPNVDSGSG